MESFETLFKDRSYLKIRERQAQQIASVSHGIVSFWRALTKQAWQLLSPENSGRLRGRQRAEWRPRVVHSVALGAVKVTHDPLGTGVHRWQTASRLCHKATGVLLEYPLHLTTLTSNLEPRVNWECQEKGTNAESSLSPFILSCTVWSPRDNKAALSWISQSCKENNASITSEWTFLPLQSPLSPPRRSVYRFPFFTLIRQKAFPCSATIAHRASQRRRRWVRPPPPPDENALLAHL